jgi:hypothetical protein
MTTIGVDWAHHAAFPNVALSATIPVAGRIKDAVATTRRLMSDLLYERRYGVRTSGLWILDVHDDQNICYIAMNWRLLRRALPTSSVSERDVFIDLGSGMGRAVLEAAAVYPFRRVIGVELVEDLHEIAEQNMTRTSRRLRCQDVELICADLRTYQIPDDVTVVFMNNPVRGPIFSGVLREISASIERNPRPIRLVYGNPLEDAAVMQTGEWRTVRTIEPPRSHWPYGATRVYEWSFTNGGAGHRAIE